MKLFHLIGILLCIKMGGDIKAAIEGLVRVGVISEEEYKEIAEKMNGV